MITNRDKKWINLAANIASSSNHRFQLGAVIVDGGSVLGTGTNVYLGTSIPSKGPRSLSAASCVPPLGSSIHAEVQALRSLSETARNKRSTIYVTRLSAKNETTMAKPCAHCIQTLMLFSQVRRVVYTGFNGEAVDLLIRDVTLPEEIHKDTVYEYHVA